MKIQLLVHITCNYSKKNKNEKDIAVESLLKARQFKTMQVVVISSSFSRFDISLASPLYDVLDCQSIDDASNNRCQSFRHNSLPIYLHTEKDKIS